MTNMEKLPVFSVRETSVEWMKAVVLDSIRCFGQCVSVDRVDLEISNGQITEEWCIRRILKFRNFHFYFQLGLRCTARYLQFTQVSLCFCAGVL